MTGSKNHATVKFELSAVVIYVSVLQWMISENQSECVHIILSLLYKVLHYFNGWPYRQNIVIIPLYDLHKVLKLHVQQHRGLFATVVVAILSSEFIPTLDQKPS